VAFGVGTQSLVEIHGSRAKNPWGWPWNSQVLSLKEIKDNKTQENSYSYQ
jgi:hypothetical protein